MTADNQDQRKGRATMAQIAQVAGVSPSTVSFVLSGRPNAITISEATERRVIETAKSLGYRPNAAARSLATGRAHTVLIAVLGPVSWDQNLTGRLRGAMEYLTPLGYSTHICTIEPTNVEPYIDILRSGKADGVLLTGQMSRRLMPVLQIMRETADQVNVPLVAFAKAFPPELAPALADFDDFSGGRMAATHLIEHGHQRILMLSIADQEWAQAREAGYKTALQDAGLLVDDKLIIRLDEHSQDAAYETVTEAIGPLAPTAIFVISDMLAVAAISALKAKGRSVPSDCAVIGYDDTETWCRFIDPPLTSVHNPFYDSGKAGAEALLAIIEGQTPESVVIPVSLAIRKSCGCAPSA